ncbi:MAG: RNA polymerase sigma factor, partial [Candidatus Dormibacteraceae bacterium]
MRPNPELVEAARQGDVEALGELLAQCHPDARRFARSLCPTPEDAEDAVQETLWIISRRIGALRVTAAFTTWLFRLVKH